VVEFCKHCNEASGSINVGDCLTSKVDYQHFKENIKNCH
jgi:hypothetical protein